MAYEKDCSEILNLFRLAGKDVPHVDSDTGQAVIVLQAICDQHGHTIPNADKLRDEMQAELIAEGWHFFPGNEPGNLYPHPYAQLPGTLTHVEGNDMLTVIGLAYWEAGLSDSLDRDLLDAVDELESLMDGDDFTFEFDGNEYRIIKDSSIWDIYKEEIQRIVEDCYSDVINLDKMPSFIAFSIDWEATAKNCYVDGYGHTFSSYDGSEYETDNDWWIFRTN
jgi:hypothetical protein